MSIFIDRKFLGLVQYRLERFVQKNNDLYNFRCPFCLDSKKNKSKARGYIYRKVNNYFYRCHNCGVSITFGHFLKHIDQTAYKQYVLEQYADGGGGHSPVAKPDFEDLKGNAFEHFLKRPKVLSISKVSDLPESHYAKDYIINRRIPEEFWNEIYYTDKFKDFMDADFPEHGKVDLPNDDRIVLFYTDENGNITNVAGRALSDIKLRYISIKVSDAKKIFGLHRLDVSKPAVVVEGQFDSFFIGNCVATGDSALYAIPDQYPDIEWTMVYDNEPRNKEIVREVRRAILRGYHVCIFPTNLPEKDINDMVIAGHDVNQLIRDNTYQGATAMMKFIGWNKT
jgi:transcription elongation factor Elf1